MKQTVNYMLLLSVTSMYAASTEYAAPTEQVEMTVIEKMPERAMNNKIHVGIANTPPECLKTSLGGIYVGIDKSPFGINSLWNDAAVASGANASYIDITSHASMQVLTKKVTDLAKDAARLIERIAALSAWGAAYARLQEQRTQKAIPGLQLWSTVSDTIISNSQIVLNDARIVAYKISLLSIAMCMNRQFNLDGTAFEKEWHNYLELQPTLTDALAPAGQRPFDRQYHGCVLI